MEYMINISLYFTPLAMCEAAPGDITLFLGDRITESIAITGPVVVGVNQTVSIWCRAENTAHPGTLRAVNWRYSDGYRVIQPVVEAGETSDHDVYVEREAGHGRTSYTLIWSRVLHFKRIHPSSAGIYVCVANYDGVFRNQSMEIQVSGEWMCTASMEYLF